MACPAHEIKFKGKQQQILIKYILISHSSDFEFIMCGPGLLLLLLVAMTVRNGLDIFFLNLILKLIEKKNNESPLLRTIAF